MISSYASYHWSYIPIYSKAYRKIAFNLRSLSQTERRATVCVSRVSRPGRDTLNGARLSARVGPRRRAAPIEATRGTRHTRGPRAQRLDVGRRGMRLRVRRMREP